MKQELPLAFVEHLAQNESAMARFEAMSEPEKNAVLNQLKNVQSKSQMRSLVDSIGKTGENQKTATDNQWVSTGLSNREDSRERRDGPGGEDA